MGSFKKSTTLKGNYKNICIREGAFADAETGDIIPLADQLAAIYGEDTEFDLITNLKTDEDL